MANKQSDVLEPRYDGALIRNKFVKAGLFIVKTKTQRNTEIKTLYRELDGSTTTLCYVSADSAIYELIANPSSEGTVDSDWKRLDFGVSDILVAKGLWDADNTTPVLQDDPDAVNNGNDFYVVTGAATPTMVQHVGLFGGAQVTVTDGDWVISNGTEWFVSGAPINWDSISGIPTVIVDYIGGTVIAHPHSISDITGLQVALDTKFDISDVGDHGIAWSTVPDAKLVDAYLLKTNYWDKTESYSITEVDVIIAASNPLTTKGDFTTHNGTIPVRKGVGADGEIIIADAAEAEGWRWGANISSGWAVTGTTFLTGATIIDQNNSLLTFKTGELSTSGFVIFGTLDTDVDVNIFRFNHNPSTASAAGLTEVFLGANNGNVAGEAWGNIVFGQNNMTGLLPVGEWQGGRNIVIGYGNAPQFTTPAANMSTHNIILGRKIFDASGGDISYVVAAGYEVATNVTSLQAGVFQQAVIMGIWAFEGTTLDAAADDIITGHDLVVIGTSAFRGGTTMYNHGNSGAERGGITGMTALGTSAFRDATVERYNIGIGDSAFRRAIIGRGNIAVGVLAGADMTGGLAGNTGTGQTIFNTLMGVHTGQFLVGNKNAYYGSEAGSSAVAGNFNAGFGTWSLNRLIGEYNSGFGAYAGFAASPLTGDYNTFVGARASYDIGNLAFDNSMVIGSNFNQLMASDKIYIGSPTQNVIFNGALVQNDLESQVAVINSTTGELEFRDSASIAAVPVGNDGDIQFKTGTLLDADPDFNYDKANNVVLQARNYSNTSAGTNIDSWISGDDIQIIGAGTGRLAWTIIAGDVFVFDNGGTFRSFANGFVTGTGQTVRIANGAFGVFSSNMWGSANLIEPANAGNYVYSMVGGASNISRNSYQMVSGANADVLGIGAWVHGSGGAVKNRVDGDWGVLLSSNTGAQTAGHGVLADYSVIIGGVDHNIPADSHYSVILGGQALKMPAATEDTVMLKDLLVDGKIWWADDIHIGVDALDGLTGTGVVNLTNDIFMGQRVLQNTEIILGGGFNSDMVIIGADALANATVHDGFAGIFLGSGAGDGSEFFDYYHIFIGYNAGAGASVIGRANIVIGTNAFNGALGGQTGLGGNANNIAIGSIVANGFLGGIKNVIIGSESGNSGMQGDYNVILGAWAGREVTGDRNSFLGAYAGFGTAKLTGDDNTMVGAYANTSEATRTVNSVMVIGNSTGAGFRPDAVTGTVYIGSIAHTEIWTDHDGVLYKYKFVDGDILDKSDVSILGGGGGGWATGGTTNLTTAVTTIVGSGINHSLSISDHIQSGGFFVLSAGSALEGAVAHGGAIGALISDPNNLYAQGAGFYFIDYRAGAAQVGLEYNADYSANYSALSLAAYGSVWKNTGTTTLSGDVFIDGGTTNSIAITNQSGTNQYVSIGSYDTGFDEVGLAVDGDAYALRLGYGVDVLSDIPTGSIEYGIEASATALNFYRGGAIVDFWATAGATQLTANVTINVQEAETVTFTQPRPDFITIFTNAAEWVMYADGSSGFYYVDSDSDENRSGIEIFDQNNVKVTGHVNTGAPNLFITPQERTAIGQTSSSFSILAAQAYDTAVKQAKWGQDVTLLGNDGESIWRIGSQITGTGTGYSQTPYIIIHGGDGKVALGGQVPTSTVSSIMQLHGSTASMSMVGITAPTDNVFGKIYVDTADSELYFRDAAGAVSQLSGVGGGLANTTTNLTTQTDFGTTSDGRLRFETATADFTVGDVYMYNVGAGSLGGANERAFLGLIGRSTGEAGFKDHVVGRYDNGTTNNSYSEFEIGRTDGGFLEAKLTAFADAATDLTSQITVSSAGVIQLITQNSGAGLPKAVILIDESSQFTAAPLTRISATENTTTGNVRVLEIERLAGTGFGAANIAGSFAIMLEKSAGQPVAALEVEATLTDATSTTEESLIEFHALKHNVAHTFLTYDTDINILTSRNYNFNVEQTVGAGQDNFVLTYDNGTGLIGLEAAGGGGWSISGDTTLTATGAQTVTLDTTNGASLNLQTSGSVANWGLVQGSSIDNVYAYYGSASDSIFTDYVYIYSDWNNASTIRPATNTPYWSEITTTVANTIMSGNAFVRRTTGGGTTTGVGLNFPWWIENGSNNIVRSFEIEVVMNTVTNNLEEHTVSFSTFKDSLARDFLVYKTTTTSLALATGSASGADSLAIGASSNAIGADSISIGFAGIQAATGGIGIGRYSQTTAQGAIMIGYHTSSQQNTTSDSLRLAWDGTEVMKVGLAYGMVLQGATGGQQGTGTINTQGLYVNGVEVSTTYVAINSTGTAANAVGTDGIAIGEGAEADGISAIAIGVEAAQNVTTAQGGSISIGDRANFENTLLRQFSITIGDNASVGGDSAIAIGRNVTAIGALSISIGASSDALGSGITIGNNAQSDNQGLALGGSAEAHENFSIAIGTSAASNTGGTTNIGSITIGGNANGNASAVIGLYSMAMGYFAHSNSEGSQAYGRLITAGADQAILMGYSAQFTITNDRANSFAVGWGVSGSASQSIPAIWIETYVATTTGVAGTATMDIPLDEDSVYTIEITVTGGEQDATPTMFCSFKFIGAYQRITTAAPVALGSTPSGSPVAYVAESGEVSSAGATENLDAALSISGNNIRITVSGADTTSTDMDWRALVKLTKVIL